MVRCKMRCDAVTTRIGNAPAYDDSGKHTGYAPRLLWDVEFNVVYSEKKDDENKKFCDATPSGSLKFATIKAMPWALGQEYYVDIHPARSEEVPTA